LVSNRRFFRDAAKSRHRVPARFLLPIMGALLAAGSFLLPTYALGFKYRVLGVFFMSAILGRTENGWEDLAGPLTMPAALANAVFAFWLPQLPVALMRWARASRHHKRVPEAGQH